MAVREGFEPSMRDKPHTPLAGERLQPLGHLTVLRRHILRFTENMSNVFLVISLEKRAFAQETNNLS